MILHYLIEKELKQTMRNWLLPVIFVILPLALMNVVPRIATQEIKGLHFCVIDNDHSTASRRLIQKIDASTYLSLVGTPSTYDEAMQEINAATADIILEIPRGFEKALVNVSAGALANGSEMPNIMISANSVNGTKGSMGQNYMMQIVQAFGQEMREEKGTMSSSSSQSTLTTSSQSTLSLSSSLSSTSSFSIQPRYLFNISLDYKRYMAPAIFALLLMLIVGFLPALNIVGEKEKGTIEQINVTPISKMEFILSKLIPYFFIGLFMMTLALMACRALYGFTSVGSLLTLYLFVSLFSLVAASIGLVISNYATTMQQGALTMFFFLIIMILMSGLLTPVVSMPEWAQQLTLLNPMRYSIEAFRSIFIKGASLADLQLHFWALTAMLCFFGFWAVISYRKNA